MTADPTDTIFAVATGAGRSAVAIVRVSGPAARQVAEMLAGRMPRPRIATVARMRDPSSGETLDQALVLFFEGSASEVGEDGVEFHLHGSAAIVGAVLGVLGRIPGVRQAEPGEFARRAFGNGKLDLAQTEALADLIDAETEWQRRQALRQLSGAMREVTAPWRAALIAAAADIETAIDFAEDVDPNAAHFGTIRASIDPIRAGLRAELAGARAAERIRDGVQIVIAGPPNAGKSTLLNALVRREAAIVSAVAGTTRDPVEVHLDLGGYPVTLIDTAGLRDSTDPIEQIGVARAHERASTADLVLWLSENDMPPPPFACPVWRIGAKADLAPAEISRKPPAASIEEPLPLSARTGLNLDILIETLTAFARAVVRGGASGILARTRHRQAFEVALAALDHAAGEPPSPIEILAEDLRTARFALERLIGAVDVEDVLGDIFSRFCIGK